MEQSNFCKQAKSSELNCKEKRKHEKMMKNYELIMKRCVCMNGWMSQTHVLPYRSSATLEFHSKSNQRLQQMISCHHQSSQNHNAPCTCKWMFHFSRYTYVILCTIVLCLLWLVKERTKPMRTKKKENFCEQKQTNQRQ